MFFRIWFYLITVLVSAQVFAQTDGSETCLELEQPGILIITAASDTSAGFFWRSGPGEGRISLVWPGGVLSVPDTLAMDGFPNKNLGIPLRAGFSGSGSSGPLMLADGVFPISESLMMGDGIIQLMVSDGELEIFGPRFRYTRPQPVSKADKMKANLLLVAGLLLLIGVLLRRSRKILRKRK